MRNLSAVWKCYKAQKGSGVVNPHTRKEWKGNSGAKGVNIEALKESPKNIPTKKRTTLGSTAAAFAILFSKLRDNTKKLGMQVSRSFLEPLLTDGSKGSGKVGSSLDRGGARGLAQVQLIGGLHTR
ncbi:unnamed protein product [Discosporangium mesarthrocarpum]